MALKDDLTSLVSKFFTDFWETRNGTVVPELGDLPFANEGTVLKGVVLYADLDGSTILVDTQDAKFAAEIYKAYLYCAARIVRSENGSITAYDGDRIMAVFVGDYRFSSAVRAGLKISFAVDEIINPLLRKHYPGKSYVVKQVVGIDASDLLVTKIGIRGSGDLVWVGKAANHAAKMASLSPDYPVRISSLVYNSMLQSVKEINGRNIWEQANWSDKQIYRSRYKWQL